MRRSTPSHEQTLIERGGRLELSEVENRLKDIVIPERRRNAIQITDPAFDFYDKQQKESDMRLVEREEDSIRENDEKDPEKAVQSQRAEIFEAIVEDQIVKSDWMGPDAGIIVPSRYDDIVNKIDGLVEFKDTAGATQLALGVDITQGALMMKHKFDKVKELIDRGELSTIKYFKSEQSGIVGQLTKKVPRVIIGANHTAMSDVAEQLLTFKLSQRLKKEDKSEAQHTRFLAARKALEQHTLQIKILREILAQLKAFKEYALSTGKPEIAAHYQAMRERISAIIVEKKSQGIAADDEELGEDEVYNAVIECAKDFGKR